MDNIKDLTLLIGVCALGLAIVISSLAWPIAWYNYEVTAEYVRAGYQQTTLPGAEGVYWVKKEAAQ